MELIDRNALGIGRCNPETMIDRAYAAGWNGVINIIEAAPTIDPLHALDACYCRECKHGEHYHNGMELEVAGYFCSLNKHDVSLDGFCSYGERKQKDNVKIGSKITCYSERIFGEIVDIHTSAVGETQIVVQTRYCGRYTVPLSKCKIRENGERVYGGWVEGLDGHQYCSECGDRAPASVYECYSGNIKCSKCGAWND